jgi:hypothetical protein
MKSDVKLSVTPLPGVTPIGVSINFSVGAIPVCTVDFAPAPEGVIKIDGSASGILSSPDTYKRKEEITVDIDVTSHSGQDKTTNHTFTWSGLLDGINLSNNVGSNTYQAVLKGRAQSLLELTTLTPGLTPSSVNIYKNPYYSILGASGDDDETVEKAWSSFEVSGELDFGESPLKFYLSLMKLIVKNQQGGYQNYLGNETMTNSEQALEQLFNEERYQRALTKAQALLETIDTSAVDGGTLAQITTSYPNASAKVKDYFFSGPNVLLENLMNFLGFLGLTMVFGDEKIFIVPERSFIKQSHPAPGKKQESTTPNAAYPADYNGYTYNDNGYRDVMAVILSNEMPIGGTQLIDLPYDAGLVGFYKDKNELTQASGVLVIPEHPFSMFYNNNDNNFHDSHELKDTADSPGQAYHPESKKYEDAVGDPNEKQSERATDKKQKYADILKEGEALNNYAEIKFYQARYGDRRGSITMSFNSNWAPGASGTLYVRETGFSLDFWVESITHRVDMTPPAGGSAITIINFCCGRMGTTPVGVTSDNFTGYDGGKETEFISNFISDIGAS